MTDYVPIKLSITQNDETTILKKEVSPSHLEALLQILSCATVSVDTTIAQRAGYWVTQVTISGAYRSTEHPDEVLEKAMRQIPGQDC